jgi:hypothetical protein
MAPLLDGLYTSGDCASSEMEWDQGMRRDVDAR